MIEASSLLIDSIALRARKGGTNFTADLSCKAGPKAGMRFTVITPCLNRENFIAEAIESVLAQQYHDIEHWITRWWFHG